MDNLVVPDTAVVLPRVFAGDLLNATLTPFLAAQPQGDRQKKWTAKRLVELIEVFNNGTFSTFSHPSPSGGAVLMRIEMPTLNPRSRSKIATAFISLIEGYFRAPTMRIDYTPAWNPPYPLAPPYTGPTGP